MNEADILLTNLTVKGSFWDVGLYSGFLYLWEDARTVSIYHWQKWLDHLALCNLPVYQEPLMNQSLFLESAALDPFHFKTLRFRHPMRASLLYRHRLYYIDAVGFHFLRPENADIEPILLVKGDFHQLEITTTNRIILVSRTEGVFEWHKETIIPWDGTPTAGITLDADDVLQLDEGGNPIQLLTFRTSGREPELVARVPGEKLQVAATYYKTTLDLENGGEATPAFTLFHFIPPADDTAARSIGEKVAIAKKQHPYLSQSTHDDRTLWLEETNNRLIIRLGSHIYFSYHDYRRYRLYPKSRDYRNHLHLISDEGISFFLFNKLT